MAPRPLPDQEFVRELRGRVERYLAAVDHWEAACQKYYRLPDTPPGSAAISKRFRVPFHAAGGKWVRFATWNSAGNGAFTQPVLLN